MIMQMNLFNEVVEHEKIVIPEDLESPFECKHGLKTKAFRSNQVKFSMYVRAIQEFHDCNWFEARELFFKHRESQEPIKVKRGVIDG